ncbi:hypothetical protein [Maribacter sp. 2307ULW6-5]|uniref:hypothetical protein n=1 Tax=Maribacter sp. 2307ULW6-5 TaxID=3386275 RepID=UPI0039BC3084
MQPTKNLLSLLALFLYVLTASCSKDTDLLYEAVLSDELSKELSEGEAGAQENPGEAANLPAAAPAAVSAAKSDFVESAPNEIVGTFRPKSAAEISDASKANHRAIIETPFDCNGCTFAANLTIEPAGGAITGTNIDLNGAFIENTFQQAFSANTRFKRLYVKTRLSPDTFGAMADDATADDAGLTALIANVGYALGKSGGVYVKNDETNHVRTEMFDWNMNNCIVRTTSAAGLSHGSGSENQSKYLFRFEDMVVRLANGEFDGQNLASRSINIYDVPAFSLDNVTIKDYYAPPNAFARGVALRFDLWDNKFTGASLTNNTIKNIGAASDGNANNAPFGVSKGFHFQYYGANNKAPAIISMSGNLVDNVYGDDAEGFMSAKGWQGGYNYQTNNITVVINGDTYRNCQRRAFKVNASNLDATNLSIESVATPPVFPGQQATLFQVFSTTKGQPVENISLRNSSIRKRGANENVVIGVSDAKNVFIEDNIFSSTGDLDLYDFAYFGANSSQGGLYSGDLENVVFRNNQLNNVGIQLRNNYLVPVGAGLVVDNNTMDFDITSFAGGHSGAILIYDLDGGNGGNRITVSNLKINVNLQSDGTSLWAVVKARQSSVTNLTLDNVDVNYSGRAPFHGFGHFLSNFGSSNTIMNCDVSGASTSNMLSIEGSGSPNIVNSFN